MCLCLNRIMVKFCGELLWQYVRTVGLHKMPAISLLPIGHGVSKNKRIPRNSYGEFLFKSGNGFTEKNLAYISSLKQP